jgi:hypothetical protein
MSNVRDGVSSHDMYNISELPQHTPNTKGHPTKSAELISKARMAAMLLNIAELAESG